MSDVPLMPKATAVWLVENTTLSFEQIADFCGMHPLEVQGVADGDVAGGVIGIDPVASGQLTRENLEEAQKDRDVKLVLLKGIATLQSKRTKGARYTPVAQRQDKPDAIAWILKNHPEFSDAQIAKLVGTTKSTIKSVKEKSHWNAQNIRPRDPVLLGLCSQTDLQTMIARAAGKAGARPQVEADENEAHAS